ncbi:hypothetical protein Tco_1061376, partial [Tanacetum coccineum]
GRINAIDADEDINLVNNQDDADMFNVNTLTGDEVLAEQEVAAKDVNLAVDEVTLAQALAALKSVKPKVKANVIEDSIVPVSTVSASTKVSAATTTTATIPTPRKRTVIAELGTSTTTISSQPSQAKVQDKGKGILVEEPVNPKKKDLIRLDEEIALKLQAEFDEKERLASLKDEANQKVDKDKETVELQSLIEIIPDEEEAAIDVVPLATKPPTIVDWKIHKEGKKSLWKVINVQSLVKCLKVLVGKT